MAPKYRRRFQSGFVPEALLDRIEKLTSFFSFLARLRGSRLDFQVGVFARPG